MNLRPASPRYLYHVTPKELGFLPTIRAFASGPDTTRCDEEPDIRRICTSDSVYRCLGAINYCIEEHYVYRTLNETRSFFPPPNSVSDALLTGEKWLLEDTEMMCVYTIPKHVIEELPTNWNCGASEERPLRLQKIAMTMIRAVLKEFDIPEFPHIGHIGDGRHLRTVKRLNISY
jgi:hypothetical protein